ncbi:hypothetical protein OSB04_012240 [Centaurea solstitialis]|uniref:GRF-type domain-containing protein n=1 Tax=Centaurea solstitialis TaxID=347529 RepID=A0AA38TP18_9ASTR|nr:hypothetical protein OSB04_012240 [Centaurea solstitialis]
MVECHCGCRAIVRISWTSANPGRRFFCCPNTGYDCGFFMWVDTPMFNRASVDGLLKLKINAEANLKAKTKEARMWKMLMLSSWVLFVTYALFT